MADELPHDLLELIAEKLKEDCPIDVLQFRLVRRSWAKAASPPSPGRTLLSTSLPCRLELSPYNSPLTLVASAVFLLQDDTTRMPLLVRVEERKPGKLYIQYPLSRCLHSTTELSLKDCSSRLRRVHEAVNFVWDDHKSTTSLSSFNVVLCYDRTLLKSFACVGYSTTLRTLSFFSSGKTGWMKISNKYDFDDVVSFQGHVYAVDSLGKLYLLLGKSEEDGTSMITMVSDGIIESTRCDDDDIDTRKRLVVSCQALYLVQRVALRFRVYKLKEYQWEETNRVGEGDMVLFVCTDHSFSMSVRDLPGWRGNCIVLHVQSFPKYYRHCLQNTDPALSFLCDNIHDEEEARQIGVYHLGSGDDEIIRHLSYFPACSHVLLDQFPEKRKV